MEDQYARPPRWLVCLVAALMVAFIAAEPVLLDIHPGIQVFHGIFVVWFWALFMFGGATVEKPAPRARMAHSQAPSSR